MSKMHTTPQSQMPWIDLPIETRQPQAIHLSLLTKLIFNQVFNRQPQWMVAWQRY